MDDQDKSDVGRSTGGQLGGSGLSTLLDPDDTGLFSGWRRGFRSDNKTVTFGDASSVRSLPAYSALALAIILLGWWAATRTWGMPKEFADQFFSETPDGTQKLMIAACNRAEDVCGKDAYFQLISAQKFPSMADTWNAAVTLFTDGFQNKTVWEQTWASLWRVIRGMVIGSAIGVPIGMWMGLSSRARGFFDAPVELFRPIPPFALIPLFIAAFGIGDAAAVPLLVFASLWIMIIAARAGMRNANLSKVRAAYSLGASKRQVLTKVLIPNALPEIFTGIRVALGVSWGTLVAAELVGTNTGLGAMIFQARNFTRLDVIVVGIIIIAVIGVLMDVIIRFLESILIPWQGKG